jgi:hypothetical protein
VIANLKSGLGCATTVRAPHSKTTRTAAPVSDRANGEVLVFTKSVRNVVEEFLLGFDLDFLTLLSVAKNADLATPKLGLNQFRSLLNKQSRRGSCSRRGTISLNPRLIQTPPFVRDCIILHELMHLRQMNYSARFWREVERVCPEHETAEKWLKQNSELLK